MSVIRKMSFMAMVAALPGIAMAETLELQSASVNNEAVGDIGNALGEAVKIKSAQNGKCWGIVSYSPNVMGVKLYAIGLVDCNSAELFDIAPSPNDLEKSVIKLKSREGTCLQSTFHAGDPMYSVLGWQGCNGSSRQDFIFDRNTGYIYGDAQGDGTNPLDAGGPHRHLPGPLITIDNFYPAPSGRDSFKWSVSKEKCTIQQFFP
jgi:hypothetical protein